MSCSFQVPCGSLDAHHKALDGDVLFKRLHVGLLDLGGMRETLKPCSSRPIPGQLIDAP